MKTQAAFIRANKPAVLHPPATINFYLAVVVHPVHGKVDYPLRLTQALKHVVAFVVSMRVINRHYIGGELFGGLQEFRVVRIPVFNPLVKLV